MFEKTPTLLVHLSKFFILFLAFDTIELDPAKVKLIEFNLHHGMNYWMN